MHSGMLNSQGSYLSVCNNNTMSCNGPEGGVVGGHREWLKKRGTKTDQVHDVQMIEMLCFHVKSAVLCCVKQYKVQVSNCDVTMSTTPQLVSDNTSQRKNSISTVITDATNMLLDAKDFYRSVRFWQVHH
jgi:hypothetical protein